MNNDNFIDELENSSPAEVEASSMEEAPELGTEELVLEDAPAEDSFAAEEIPAIEETPDYSPSEEIAEPEFESIADEVAALEETIKEEESMSDVTAQSAVEEEPKKIDKPEKKEKAPKEKKEKAPKEKKTKKEQEDGENEPSRPVAPSTLYGMNLAQGERFVRDYNLVNTGTASLAIITNPRFIIKGDYTIETSADSVKGIRSCKYLQFKAVKFIFGLIFIAALVVAIMLKLPEKFDGRAWLAYLLLGIAGVIGLIGLIMVFTSFKKRFAINIFTRDFTEFVSYHSHLGKREAQMFVQILDGKPGKDFKRFIHEIGALLIDIQNGLYD